MPVCDGAEQGEAEAGPEAVDEVSGLLAIGAVALALDPLAEDLGDDLDGLDGLRPQLAVRGGRHGQEDRVVWPFAVKLLLGGDAEQRRVDGVLQLGLVTRGRPVVW